MMEVYGVAGTIVGVIVLIYLYVKISRWLSKVDETQRAVREVKQ